MSRETDLYYVGQAILDARASLRHASTLADSLGGKTGSRWPAAASLATRLNELAELVDAAFSGSIRESWDAIDATTYGVDDNLPL